MKKVFFKIDRADLEDFADKHELTMEIHERVEWRERKFDEIGASPYPVFSYEAHFTCCLWKRHADAIDAELVVGKGFSPGGAIIDYARKISMGWLKVITVEPDREREIPVPLLRYSNGD